MEIVSRNVDLSCVCVRANQGNSYGLYIAILVGYGVFVYFMMPETKRLSAEDAARVFDYDRKGVLRDKVDDVEVGGDEKVAQKAGGESTTTSTSSPKP